MKLYRALIIAVGILLGLPWAVALADYVYTDINGSHVVFSFVCQSTKLCTSMVLIDSSSNEKATLANPLRVDPTGGTNQPVSQAGSWTDTVIQPNGQNLHIVCDSGCAGSGGTASSFGAAFPSAGTAIGVQNSGNMVSLSADAAANLNINVNAFGYIGQKTLALSLPTSPASDYINDPCFGTNAKRNIPFSTTTSGTQLIAGTSAKKTYICSFTFVSSTASAVSLIEGTGASNCTAGQAAVFGNSGTASSAGMSVGANGGLTFGSGIGTISSTAVNADNLCIIFTTTNGPTVAGNLTVVQQ